VVGSADEICLLSRNVRTIKEAYQKLKEAAMEIGLKINPLRPSGNYMNHLL
jgi:hypothetical protein